MNSEALDYQNVRLFNFKGRMGRLRFFAYSIILPLCLSFVPVTIEMLKVFNSITLHGTGDPKVLAVGISKAIAFGIWSYFLVGTLIAVIAGAQRFHDLNLSGWFSIFQLIPLSIIALCLFTGVLSLRELTSLGFGIIFLIISILTIILCFVSGDEASNKFGFPTRKNTKWVWLGICGPFFSVGLLILSLYVFGQ